MFVKINLIQMKKILIITIFSFFLLSVFSQNTNTADSLFNILKTSVVDTVKVNIYNELSWLYIKSDFEKAYEYADSALIISQKVSFKKGIAVSYTHKAYAQIRMGKPDDALISINKSLAIFEILQDNHKIAKSYATIAQIYYTKQDYQKAVDYTQKSIDLKQKNKIINDLEINYMILGVIYTEQGKYTEALEMFLKSNEYCEKNENENSIASNYNNIAIVYSNLNDEISAIEYYNKSLDIYIKLQNKHGELKILNNLAVVYEKNKNLTKAKEYYNKALSSSREINYPKGIAMTLSNLASINITEKSYNKAKENLSEANILYSNMDDNYGIVYVNFLIGQLYYETGNYYTAVNYTKKAFDLASNLGLAETAHSSALQLSNIYEDMSDYKKSLKYYKDYHNINDSIFNAENSGIIEEMKNKFSLENKEKELKIKNQKIELLEKQKKLGTIKNYALISVILLVLIIIVFVIIFFKGKIKRNNELAAKNKEIADTEKKILELEIKSKEFKANQLEHEIEYKNKELQNFAHYIVDKNEFIIKIQNDLKKVKKNIAEKDTEINLQSVLTEINNKIVSERENEEFLAHVDQINSNFYYKLKEKYPEISENEQRLASLLKIGLLSKEIASILHITPKSVDTNRYRLRKKMNLSQDVNLKEFFKNL